MATCALPLLCQRAGATSPSLGGGSSRLRRSSSADCARSRRGGGCGLLHASTPELLLRNLNKVTIFGKTKLLYYPPIMEKQMEKEMENEMETGGT